MFGKNKVVVVEKTPEERLKALEDGIGRMTTALEGMPSTIATAISSAMGDQHKTQQQLDEGAAEQRRAADEETRRRGEEPDEDALEEMSKKEFLTYMSKHISEVVLKPVVDRLEQGEHGSANERKKQEFLHYAQANPEFVHWRNEMKHVLARNPELGPADVMALAKAKATPERVAEVRAAVDPEATKAAEQKKKDEESAADIISFFPRATPKEDQENAGRMSADDAAEDAWDGIFGSTTELTGGMSR